MKKLVILALAALWCGAAQSAPTLADEEAHYLGEFRKTGDLGDLIDVARVREERGKWKEASAAWGLVARQGRFSGVPGYGETTYIDLADWFKTRIAARSRGVKPASMSARRAANSAYLSLIKNPSVQNAQRVDLDGDGLPEVVHYIYTPANASVPSDFLVKKWSKNQYLTEIRIGGKERIPMRFRTAKNAQGWGEIYLDYSGARDDNMAEQILISNSDYILQVPQIGETDN